MTLGELRQDIKRKLDTYGEARVPREVMKQALGKNAALDAMAAEVVGETGWVYTKDVFAEAITIQLPTDN